MAMEKAKKKQPHDFPSMDPSLQDMQMPIHYGSTSGLLCRPRIRDQNPLLPEPDLPIPVVFPVDKPALPWDRQDFYSPTQPARKPGRGEQNKTAGIVERDRSPTARRSQLAVSVFLYSVLLGHRLFSC